MSTQALHFVPPNDFKARARAALDDRDLRASFRGAMDFLQTKRAVQFSDADECEALRDLGEAIRQDALSHLPQLLAQFEAKLVARGVVVHWADTPEQANAIVLGIAQSHRAKRVIKGKSMASEEIELNDYLAEHGVTCTESDLGEFIVQLAGEKPSHIVMPAIHKTKRDIASLFEARIQDAAYTEDVDALLQTGRRALRHAFVEADIGLSGVNFAAADTGTLWLVENEGNGRLSTTVPDVHIALMGIEKVVRKLDYLVPLSSLLTRSATGQAITTYFNLITGPRRDGERDGPREMHVVLLDNGRTQAYADEQLRATLQCIRCGACMNHCPVYTRIGGHAYGTTYPGPIGKIISPHLLGLAATADLPTASSLCGACAEVCPVRIPIPQLLVRLRTEANRAPDEAVEHPLRGQGASYSQREQIVWRFWRGAFAHPRVYRVFRWAATRLRALTPAKQMGWTQHRTPLKPAARSLADLLRARDQAE
jgi:L-lactate dehydrogenase complex protein LldF